MEGWVGLGHVHLSITLAYVLTYLLTKNTWLCPLMIFSQRRYFYLNSLPTRITPRNVVVVSMWVTVKSVKARFTSRVTLFVEPMPHVQTRRGRRLETVARRCDTTCVSSTTKRHVERQNVFLSLRVSSTLSAVVLHSVMFAHVRCRYFLDSFSSIFWCCSTVLWLVFVSFCIPVGPSLLPELCDFKAVMSYDANWIIFNFLFFCVRQQISRHSSQRTWT